VLMVWECSELQAENALEQYLMEDSKRDWT